MAELIDVNVECAICHRFARCMQMRDGTVYRPFAWTFPLGEQYRGICPNCSEDKETE